MNYTTYGFVVEEADAVVRKMHMESAPVEFRDIAVSQQELQRVFFKKKVRRKVKSLLTKIKRRLTR